MKAVHRLDIECLAPLQLPLVNRFYRQCRYAAKAGRGEQVYVVKAQGSIVAAVRLVPKPQHHRFLRSFCVAPPYRRQGVGTYLLRALAPALAPAPCYCFPFARLQAFYAAAGFVVREPQALPDFIQQPFNRYRLQGRDIIVMLRPAAADDSG